MSSISLDLVAWFVHPLLLAGVLAWIGYRYAPLLIEAGRGRLYLLMAMSLGLLAVQAAGVHRQAYPLATWTMYGSPEVDPVTWRFVGVSGTDRTDFPWEAVAPVREVRAFERHFTTLARQIESETASEADRERRRMKLSGLLATLLEEYNRHPPGIELDRIEVLRCEVDIRAFVRRDQLECQRLLAVEA